VTSPAGWFLLRLGDHPEVRISQNPFGTYDVVLQIDGDYPHEADALRAVGIHRAELAAMRAVDVDRAA
jgi:hypothetical protein